jgi:PAS domain S-box-containing protein
LGTTSLLLFAFYANMLIAAGGFLSNRHRLQNMMFSLFAVAMGCWPMSVYLIVTSTTPEDAMMFMSIASYVAAFFLVAFQLLCISISSGDTKFRTVFKRAFYPIVLTQIFGLLSFAPFFISGVTMPDAENPFPVPVGAVGFHIVNGYVILCFFITLGYFVRKLRKLTGVQKAELQYAMLGLASCLVVATVLSLAVPLLLKDFNTLPFGPLGTIPMNLIILYGIATQRILSVSNLLQRFTAYGLLAGYLSTLYSLIFFVSRLVMGSFVDGDLIPHLLAAVTLAFSMSPVNGVLQEFSRRLFINPGSTDIRKVADQAKEIFAAISTTDAILQRFVKILDQSGIDAERSKILLVDRDILSEWIPPSGPSRADTIQLDSSNSLIRHLVHHQEPLTRDSLRRMRPTASLRSVSQTMDEYGVQLAIGIFFKGRLLGSILLGPRLSGRIYSSSEQDALQILSNQLAVALENANLYTEVENNRIYNDILVDNLVSGVIAVNREGEVTVFNREAQRITGTVGDNILGKPLSCMPQIFADTLRLTLQSGVQVTDQEAVLSQNDDEPTPIRMGSSLFHSAHGDPLGALLVVSDLTARKKLELLVRRSDRLASIGTLSAGMAHEIKNPLVTIKTFAELLPERYQDADFRDTFAGLVSQEVQRIDRIVNQLLHFARPAKANLSAGSLDAIIENSIGLMQEQMKLKNIQFELSLGTGDTFIEADANLLDQALINLMFNAVDSMAPGGTLTVLTDHEEPPWHVREQASDDFETDYIHLMVRDTGCGISKESISQVFDPFFTTKSHGTGLGLSIAHGIIKEHNGLVDVESQPDVGTAFHLFFPLTSKEVLA